MMHWFATNFRGQSAEMWHNGFEVMNIRNLWEDLIYEIELLNEIGIKSP